MVLGVWLSSPFGCGKENEYPTKARLSKSDPLPTPTTLTPTHNAIPKLIPQVVGCKDTIAQSYLMDCLIQVFPDEFHLASLEPFLDGVCRLKEKVRVRPVLESLMERIGNYVEEHPDALPRDVSVLWAVRFGLGLFLCNAFFRDGWNM